MKPLYVRSLTAAEQEALQHGLKSTNGFTVRRAQMLLMSGNERLKVDAIGERLGCRGQAVRQAIHAFHREGLACLQVKSRARHDDQRALDERAGAGLKDLIRLSPRALGYETSLWTLDLLAEASYAQGLTSHPVHPDTISETLDRLDIGWRRAKQRINSPDEHYTSEKKRRDWLKAQARQQPDGLLLEEDECWFSRFAQPQAHAWAEAGAQLHLVQREPKRGEQEKALACFGARRQDREQVYLYFSPGQPNSEHQWVFIMAWLALARQEGKSVVVIIWDNASWHLSHRIRAWIRAYNRAAKTAGEPRLLVHGLPLKSPWLNPIEPRWVHAKRAVCEPDGELAAIDLRRRLCAHFNTEPLANLFKL